MKIALSEIKGLDKRVRQQMSPEKLEELVESLKELGQICPVKVRPNGRGYVLVYGHRRVIAAKAAGLKEIEAIVDDLPEDKVLTQALAENVIREDMAAIDIAKALQTIIEETGCMQEELGKRLGWERSRVQDYLAMLRIPAPMTTMSSFGFQAVGEIRAGAGGDEKLTAQVLKRVAKEDLTTRQTRRVAEVAKRAQDFGGQKAVDRVLARPSGEILRTAETLPPRKPRPIARELPGRIHFQWIKDPRSILADEGVRAISVLISAIARSEEDRSGGKAVLKNLRRSIANVLNQLDTVLGRM